MVLRGLFVLLLGAGCGRLSFDGRAQREDAALGIDVSGEGGVDAYVGCGLRAAPDPLTISGSTFRYTSFDNNRTAMSGVTVRLRDRTTDALLDEVTSGTGGAYSVQVATGGQPANVMLEFAVTGYFVTRVVPEAGVDADVVGPFSALWALGDGPVWNDVAMDMVYTQVGTTLSAAKSSVNIAVRDCAGNAVDGVTVTVDPPPEVLSYQAADGRPSVSLTGTVAPYAHALLHNATPGLTRITGTKAGKTFVDLQIDVPAGQYNTLTILRMVD